MEAQQSACSAHHMWTSSKLSISFQSNACALLACMRKGPTHSAGTKAQRASILGVCTSSDAVYNQPKYQPQGTVVTLAMACLLRRLHLFNGPDMMALPGVKPLMDLVIGVSAAGMLVLILTNSCRVGRSSMGQQWT